MLGIKKLYKFYVEFKNANQIVSYLKKNIEVFNRCTNTFTNTYT